MLKAQSSATQALLASRLLSRCLAQTCQSSRKLLSHNEGGRPTQGGQKQKPKNCKAACLGLLAAIRDLCSSQTSTNPFTSRGRGASKTKELHKKSLEINQFLKASKLLRTIESKTALRRKGLQPKPPKPAKRVCRQRHAGLAQERPG